LMFRVLFQGFLERAAAHRGHLRELLFDLPRPVPVAEDPAAMGKSPLEPALAAEQAAAELNPYEAPQTMDDEPPALPPAITEQPELRGTAAWCAIGISSVVFALLHLGHGPD